ncbi:unnamed protein product [Orchesella dallaii]|uniref:C2H2-type domain-containing protein n=1 Tax=Orchesella dallaii TaxID=48710 RepID=A0ABP1RHK4_9HEXA
MSLQKHLRRIHGRLRGKEFATDDGSPRWRKSKCRYPSCNQEFGEENELKLHVEREHQSQNEKSGTPNFLCSLCGRIFVNQQRLTRHNEVHTKEKRYKCHICQKSLSQPSSVKEHLMAVHGVGKDQEYLSCTQLNCSFKTKGRSLLLKHLRSMHGVYTGKPREKSEGHDKVQS